MNTKPDETSERKWDLCRPVLKDNPIIIYSLNNERMKSKEVEWMRKNEQNWVKLGEKQDSSEFRQYQL